MKISVIVPVYKVEEYLCECIDSILNQSFSDFELILVDDGSPDNCSKICDEYAQKDSRIIVIHKENGGLSSARNAGLDIAKGEYIAFIDSDDWVDKNYLSYLYSVAENSNCDISACDITITSSYSLKHTQKEFRYEVYSPEQALDTLICGKVFRAVAWNKLYKKDLLQNESFEIGKYHEDEFFTYRIIHKCKQLAYVDIPLYYYRQREQSIMHTTSPKHLDALEAFVERLNLLKSHYPDLYPKDLTSFCIACINLYKNSIYINTENKNNYKKTVKYYRNQVKIPFNVFIKHNFKSKALILGSKYCIFLMSKLLGTENK